MAADRTLRKPDELPDPVTLALLSALHRSMYGPSFLQDEFERRGMIEPRNGEEVK